MEKMQKESPEIMVFNLTLSKLLDTPIEIPPESNEKWMTICDENEFVLYTDLIKHINSCQDSTLITKAFSQDSFQSDLLSTELNRHLSYLNKIISSEQILQFTSQMRLDPQTLLSILEPDKQIVFKCAINLLKCIFTIIKEEEEQEDIFLSFINFLIPHELLESRKKRSYIKTILYLPAISATDGLLNWLLLSRDKKTITRYSFEDPNSPAKIYKEEEYKYDFYSDQIQLIPLDENEPTESFNFLTSNSGRTWLDAFNWKEEYDPLFVFLSSIPHITDFCKFLPEDFYFQIASIIEAPDLDLAQAICITAANEFKDGEHTKSACLAILYILNKAGHLTQFIRRAFADAVDDTSDTTNIFRMSSAASMSSGIILTNAEDGLSSKIAEFMKEEMDNLPNAVSKLITMGPNFTPPMRFVLGAAFRATRRKFPSFLVPLNAISSILMLRYLVTELTQKSMELAKLCQSLTLTLMFSTKVEQLPDDLYKQLALFLANLTIVQNDEIVLNTSEEQARKDIISFLLFQKEDKYINQIVKILTILTKKEHPIKWSIIECFENICCGVDENFEEEMKDKLFLPQRYTRRNSSIVST